ncbi:hypothetical protein O6H91_01G088400 [Diphasiastrum complanatum]|uniref:Uncharacterized protein n=1 Tax=Diphasiastrum complanatum TaxID=34168 RepID=A0ACC2ETJ8_DIPCM|nr:hypothetical protein O6H91_Y018900 [Diphasiastrum complanatum]KAJ7569675.1 hypothetical protein O6H91_01G088400 [Diphasiastrum complanatum]
MALLSSPYLPSYHSFPSMSHHHHLMISPRASQPTRPPVHAPPCAALKVEGLAQARERPSHLLSKDPQFYQSRSRPKLAVVARLFDPEHFDPSKLTVVSSDESMSVDASLTKLLPRTYTLTHSDWTGQLLLSVGPFYNERQLGHWYTRFMRDEIVAEWKLNRQASLHVHCHVSGGHCLLAPAALRNRIFEREMPLVLQAICYADEKLLANHPDNPKYNRADCWGSLSDATNSVRSANLGSCESGALASALRES